MRDAFNPRWLADRLAAVLPGYPDISLCVALSGGLDSTVLLAALAAGRRKLPRSRDRSPRLRAVHVNHGIHPNAARWSSHCTSLARRLGVPIEVLTTKVNRSRGASLEAAARDARYALLKTSLAPDEVLLTAHHEDDQLETVLLQLFRGSGLAGIAAMPERARFAGGWLVRPLLSRSRAQLLAWAESQALEWIEDDTNRDEALDRNYLRRTVLPLIRSRWVGVGGAVARSARHAAEGQELLDQLAGRDVERAADGDSLTVGALRALPLNRRRNALRFWVAQSGHLVPDTRRLEEISGPMLSAREDANPRVEWGDVAVERGGGVLTIRRVVALAEGVYGGTTQWRWRSDPSCLLPADGGRLELRADPRGPIDLEALPDPLTVRKRLGGERLRPRRAGPRRTLKSLLQESHVAVTERSKLPLLYAGERLVGVADLWLDESVQAGPDTQRRGRLRWHK